MKKTLHVNVYQHVNSKENYEAMQAVLDNIYALARWANLHGHNMILSGDLNATLKDSLHINYADSLALLPGDELLSDCFSATNASLVSENEVVTWKSKVGQQQAVLDHIWFWPPSLRETGAGVEWQEDSRFDHAIRWASFDGSERVRAGERRTA
eukprot:3350314-Rhodomonas_salina.1